MARALGLAPDDLWFKRDDLCGLAGGGNKVRKLEYSCAAARAAGAKALVTSGAAQSNHARLTAAAGARLGFTVVLVLAGSTPPVRRGNLLLDGLLGAEIEWAGDVALADLDQRVAERADQLTRMGIKATMLPFGGSDGHAAQAYVDCADEILMQSPGVDHVVVAVGSGGTMAGLVARLGPERVLGVDVGAVADAPRRVVDLAAAIPDRPGLGRRPLTARDLRLRGDQIGDGYGSLTAPAAEVLRMAARTEGTILDPTYTARALAGLQTAVRDRSIRPGERTVFVHTGGFPSVFAHPDPGFTGPTSSVG